MIRINDYKTIKRVLRTVAVFTTLMAFSVTTLAQSTTVYSITAPRPQGHTARTLFDLRTFSIPGGLGSIEDKWIASQGADTVIHIQDAHCNYDAQKKIALIIGHLNREYGIDSVNLEGGEGSYDLTVFSGIKDGVVRNRTSDYFVKKGLLSGAEYFDVNHPGRLTLWGAETTGYYLENLGIYKSFLENKEEADSHLENIRLALEELKELIYTPELLKFDKKKALHEDGRIDFKDYLNYLLERTKKKNIDLSSMTGLTALSVCLGKEAEIDFSKAERERDALVDRMKTRLSRKEIEGLVVKMIDLDKGKISQLVFYRDLFGKAQEYGVRSDTFGELEKYVEYIAKYETVDKRILMEDIDELEKLVKSSMFQNDKQRELDLLSSDLGVLRALFSISLSRDKYGYYVQREDCFSVDRFMTFIKRHAGGLELNINEDVRDLDVYRRQMASFYECSFKRDRAFVRNLKFRGSSDIDVRYGKRATILITGGFHTSNLCRLFKQRGISYVSIVPEFTNDEDYENPYFSLLAKQRGSFYNSLIEEVSALALYSDFSEKVSKVYTPSEIEANRLWIKLVNALFSERKSVVVGDRYYTFSSLEEAGPVEGVVIDGNQVFVRKARPADIETSEEGSFTVSVPEVDEPFDYKEVSNELTSLLNSLLPKIYEEISLHKKLKDAGIKIKFKPVGSTARGTFDLVDLDFDYGISLTSKIELSAAEKRLLQEMVKSVVIGVICNRGEGTKQPKLVKRFKELFAKIYAHELLFKKGLWTRVGKGGETVLQVIEIVAIEPRSPNQIDIVVVKHGNGGGPEQIISNIDITMFHTPGEVDYSDSFEIQLDKLFDGDEKKKDAARHGIRRLKRFFKHAGIYKTPEMDKWEKSTSFTGVMVEQLFLAFAKKDDPTVEGVLKEMSIITRSERGKKRLTPSDIKYVLKRRIDNFSKGQPGSKKHRIAERFKNVRAKHYASLIKALKLDRYTARPLAPESKSVRYLSVIKVIKKDSKQQHIKAMPGFTSEDGWDDWVDDVMCAYAGEGLNGIGQKLFEGGPAMINIPISEELANRPGASFMGRAITVRNEVSRMVQVFNIGDVTINLYLDSGAESGRRELKKQIDKFTSENKIQQDQRQRRIVTFAFQEREGKQDKALDKTSYVVYMAGDKKNTVTPVATCCLTGLSILNYFDLTGRVGENTDNPAVCGAIALVAKGITAMAGLSDDAAVRKMIEELLRNGGLFDSGTMLVEVRPVDTQDIVRFHEREREVLKAL